MIKADISLSQLQTTLDSFYGKKVWVNWEPETVLLDIENGSEGVDPILREKVLVLEILNASLNTTISIPEFLLWLVSISNNEPAEFEHIAIPTSLELAWTIEELKKIGNKTGEFFTPTVEFKEIVQYILKEEGFSSPVSPFEFCDVNYFSPGQTSSDIINKKIAINHYLTHMTSISNLEETHNV